MARNIKKTIILLVTMMFIVANCIDTSAKNLSIKTKCGKYYKNNEAPKLVNYVSYYQIAATGKAFTELNEFSKALDDYNGIID